MKNLDEFNMKSKKPWEVEGIKWRDVTLKEITLNTEKINPKNKNPAESFLYLDISNIDNKNYKVNGWRELTWKNAPSRARKLIKSGDIVFATTRPYLKNIAIVPLDLDNQICSTGFCVLRPNTKFTTSKWIFYNVIRNKFVNYISSKMRGTSYPAVLDSDIYFSKIPLPFRNGNPDLETQKKIVEYIEANFSRIDKILEKKKKELEQLDELWESVLEQAFKPKEGEEWREVRFNELISKEKYQVGKVKVRNSFTDSGKIPVVDQGQELIRGYLDNEELKYRGPLPLIIFGDHTKVMKFIDFLFIVGADGVKILIPNEDLVCPKYFYWLLRTVKLPEKGYARHFKFLKQALYLIPFRNNQPDLEKQKEIANYLDSVYEKIKTLKEKNQKQIAQLEEMKESILDEMFNHENK